MPNLRQQAMSGVLWSTILKFSKQLVGFTVKMVLARLLMPEEFGLIAMVSVFITIASMIAEGGFGMALIQTEALTNRDIETVFTINVALGLCFAGGLWLAAPWISTFYGEPALTEVMRVLCFMVLLHQLSAIHRNLFTRDMGFRKLTAGSLPAQMVAGTVGIGMALAGFGVWALVAYSLSAASFSVVALWILSPWKPRFGFSMDSARRLFSFSAWAFLQRVFNILFQNLYVLVIGKVFTATNLAFYQRAQALRRLPVQSVFEVFNRVTFPLMSRVQNDPKRFQKAFMKILMLFCWVIYPGMGLLAAVSEPLIAVLIKEKWLPAAPYLKILCATAFVMPVNMHTMSSLTGRGRADLSFKLGMVGKAFTVVNILITLPFGVIWMLIGQLGCSFLAAIITMVGARGVLKIPLSSQFRTMAGPTAVAGVVFGSVMGLYAFLPFGYGAQLLFGLICGVFLWWGGLFLSRASFQEDVCLACEQYPVLKRPVQLSGLMRPV